MIDRSHVDVACRLKHRGPDWSGLYQQEGNFLAQQRLAIVSPLSGDQPLFNEDRTVVVVVRIKMHTCMHSMLSDQSANSTNGVQASCFDGPICCSSSTCASCCFYLFQANGEIYNHKNIRKQFAGTHTFSTGSDCEVIIPLVSLLY